MNDAEIKNYESKLTQDITIHKTNIKDYETQITKYTTLDALLTKLVDKLEQPCMVPLGDLAFIPGTLYHTNEIMVYLGEGYHVKLSSKDARDIIKHRKETLQENIKQEEKQLVNVYGKFGLTKEIIQNQNVKNIEEDVQIIDKGNGEIEIREPYHEDEAPKKYKKVNPEINEDDEKEINEMFEKLAREEEEDGPVEEMSQVQPEEKIQVDEPDQEEFNKYFKKKVSFQDVSQPKQSEKIKEKPTPMIGKIFERKVIQPTDPIEPTTQEPKKVSKFKQSRQNNF